ncbi:MAG: hypothetical protein OXM55_05925 [Bdellovibrionales bacterium]|nr:hypothetical protein [Bdellovibrionales bacterium]
MTRISWFFLIFVFFILNVGSTVILFSPMRQGVQSWLVSEEKKLLSVVHSRDLIYDGTPIKVVKFQTLKGIVLEFYSKHQNGYHALVTRVEIPSAKDGFFDHRGQAVQLAVVDLDGDGKMELLSPTFNEHLQASLNPYHYSTEAKAFIPFFFPKN